MVLGYAFDPPELLRAATHSCCAQVDFVLSPAAAYIVDILHSRSAEASAATMCVSHFLSSALCRVMNLSVFCRSVRGAILALCTSGILPLLDLTGVLVLYTIAAVIGWIAFV